MVWLGNLLVNCHVAETSKQLEYSWDFLTFKVVDIDFISLLHDADEQVTIHDIIAEDLLALVVQIGQIGNIEEVKLNVVIIAETLDHEVDTPED